MLKCPDSFFTNYALVFSTKSDKTTIWTESTDYGFIEQKVGLLENEMYSFSVQATNAVATSKTSSVEIGTFLLHIVFVRYT